MPERKVDAAGEQGGFSRQRGIEQIVEPRGDGFDSAGGMAPHERFDDAEFEQGDGHEERVRIGAAKRAEAMACRKGEEPGFDKPLALVSEFGVLAAQDIEG